MGIDLKKEREESLRRQEAKRLEAERKWQSEHHMTLHRTFRNFTTDRTYQTKADEWLPPWHLT